MAAAAKKSCYPTDGTPGRTSPSQHGCFTRDNVRRSLEVACSLTEPGGACMLTRSALLAYQPLAQPPAIMPLQVISHFSEKSEVLVIS